MKQIKPASQVKRIADALVAPTAKRPKIVEEVDTTAGGVQTAAIGQSTKSLPSADAQGVSFISTEETSASQPSVLPVSSEASLIAVSSDTSQIAADHDPKEKKSTTLLLVVYEMHNNVKQKHKEYSNPAYPPNEVYLSRRFL